MNGFARRPRFNTEAKSTRKWPTVFVLLFLKGTTGRAMKRNKEH